MDQGSEHERTNGVNGFSEGENNNDEDLDLFGDEEEAGSEDDQERHKREGLEYEEQMGDVDAPPPAPSNSQGDVDLANFGTWKAGKGTSELFHVKLPTYLSIESKPFDRFNFEEDTSQPSHGAQSGRGDEKEKPMPDENVIRWRWTKNGAGQIVRQSNARFIRWSDGSVTLQFGAEHFNVGFSTSPFMESSTAPPMHKTSSIPPLPELPLSYLSAQHSYNGFQSISGVIQNLNLNPTASAQPAQKRFMAASAADARKRAKVAFLRVDIDPEKQKEEREKEEKEKGRRGTRIGGVSASAVLGMASRRSGTRRAKGQNGRSYKLQSDEEEEDEGEDDDRKRSHRRLGRDVDYEEDDFVVPDPSSGEEEAQSEEEEDEAMFSDEDSKRAYSKKAKKRANGDGDVEMEDMEKAEFDLEDRQRKRREKRMTKKYGESSLAQSRQADSKSSQMKKMVVLSDEEE